MLGAVGMSLNAERCGPELEHCSRIKVLGLKSLGLEPRGLGLRV